MDTYLIVLEITMLNLSESGLYLGGIDSQVFRPIITAFFLLSFLVVVVIFEKYAISFLMK